MINTVSKFTNSQLKLKIIDSEVRKMYRNKENKYENELILSLAFNRTLNGFYENQIVFGNVLGNASVLGKNEKEFYRMLLDVIGLRQMILKYGNSISPELLETWIKAFQECKFSIDMLLFDYVSIYQKYDKILF